MFSYEGTGAPNNKAGREAASREGDLIENTVKR